MYFPKSPPPPSHFDFFLLRTVVHSVYVHTLSQPLSRVSGRTPDHSNALTPRYVKETEEESKGYVVFTWIIFVSAGKSVGGLYSVRPTRFYSLASDSYLKTTWTVFPSPRILLLHAEIQRESTAGRERVKAIFVRERASVTSIYCQQARGYT